ncbi:Transcription factor [Coemansia interrupta]|uniref:Transcription factor n=1 Tax=Coemansia interrupta TaxID=1126814 RepID=A0A9W8LLB2_9FUNG|nr:Transcription factor [Coemansia interrupta]
MHKRRTSKLSLEPNPFEHSFSLVRSEDVMATSGMHSDGEDIEMADAVCTATKQTAEDNSDSNGWIDTGDTAASATEEKQPGCADGALTLAEQKVKLPPVTAISGPMHAADMAGVWGAESLRSGPLSPAMLGGPAASTAKAQPPRITPRLGLTDPVLHTGLTPYINGEVQPMAAVSGFDAIKLPSALATPGIQAVIKAALEGQEISTTPGGSFQIAPSGAATTAAAGTTGVAAVAAAAAAAAAASIPTTSISLTAPPLVAASMAAASLPNLPLAIEPMSTQIVPTSEKSPSEETVPVPAAKKGTARRRKADAASENSRTTPVAKRSRTAKKKANASPAPSAKAQKAAAATEIKESEKAESDAESGPTPSDDEKRRQFLERNRIAALKCRQRKKKQLKELQERHDFVAMQNESLRAEYLRLREKSLHLRALLTAHRECPVAQSSGVFGVDNLPLGTPSVALQPLLFGNPSEGEHPLLFGNPSEGEHVKEIIAAIPPASNGVPVHAVDPNTGKPVMVGIPAVAPPNAVDMIMAAAMAATAAAGPAPTQVPLPVMPATVGTASTHATVAAAAAAAASIMPLAQSAVVVPTTATTAATYAPGFTS